MCWQLFLSVFLPAHFSISPLNIASCEQDLSGQSAIFVCFSASPMVRLSAASLGYFLGGWGWGGGMNFHVSDKIKTTGLFTVLAVCLVWGFSDLRDKVDGSL